jgi:anaerobic selenocysteine-containing dehydrogenase
MAEVHRTACNRDCPDACSILVTVEDGRAVALAGDPADPVTRGFLCERTNRFLHRQYRADRFTSPMLRKDGRLEPIGWDQALDLAAEKLLAIRAESGPAAILHSRSGGSLGILKAVASYLFERFGPVSIKRGDICSGAGDAAQEIDFGINESSDLFDLHRSKLIVLWGKNPHTSSPHLLPVLLEARRRGAMVIGIDPVRHQAARLCDHFLMPRPGADFALAMAVARHLFDAGATDPQAPEYCDNFAAHRALAHSRSFPEWVELADVPLASATLLAEAFASRKPAAILVGWGMGRRRNGSATVRTLDALGAISGSLGVPGGGVSFYFRRRAAFDLDFLGGEAAAPRTFAEARLGHEILAATDPKVRAIWVTAGNPVSMLPDSGSIRAAFASSEFNVVVDTHPTDTTDCAHLVLPTLTLLEDDDVVGAFGNHYLRASRPAIVPPGLARHEVEMLQDLARRLGLGDALAGSVRDWKRRVLRKVEAHGVSLEEIERGAVKNPFADPVLFAGRRFPTASGKVRLITEPAAPAPRPTADYPLTLLAVSTPKAQSSQWAVPPPPGPVEATVHPGSASGFRTGDRATLESHLGSIEVVLRLDDCVRPDVVLLPKGGMLRDGRCANLLVAAVETDDGGGAAYYDELVRLRPA